MLKIHAVILLIGEAEGIILEIQYGASVGSSEYRAAALASKVAFEDIVFHTFDNEHHATFDAFFFLVREVCPFGSIDKLFDGLFECVEHLFIRALYLVRIDCDSALEFLCMRIGCYASDADDNY